MRHTNIPHFHRIRPLTCLYLGFPSLSEDGPAIGSSCEHSDGVPQQISEVMLEQRLGAVQFVVQQTQEVMRKWGGSCLQVSA